MIPFKKINTKDYDLSKVQDNMDNTIKFLDTKSLLGGVYKDTALTTSDTIINHGLGKEWTGWIVTDQDSAATVYRSSTTNNSNDKQIILKASASVNVKLYIF